MILDVNYRMYVFQKKEMSTAHYVLFNIVHWYAMAQKHFVQDWKIHQVVENQMYATKEVKTS